jgi:hypothetical protein
MAALAGTYISKARDLLHEKASGMIFRAFHMLPDTYITVSC